jgi:hypothetical protein
MGKQPRQRRRGETHDEPGELAQPGAHFSHVGPLQRPLARATQHAVDHLRRALGAVHREVHAAGEHRVDEGRGVASHDPAVAAELAAFIRVVARGFEIAEQACIRHAGLECRHRVQDVHQEGLERAGAPAQCLGLQHRADAGDIVVQRDQPDPALLETIDADVPGPRRCAPFDAGEMCEHGGAAVARVTLLEPERAAEEGVPAGGIDQVARANRAGRARLVPHRDLDRFAREVRLQHFGVLVGQHARTLGVAEQQGIELLALHLVGMVRQGFEPVREIEHVEAALVLGRKIRGRLAHADALDLAEHTQALEDGQVHRQEGFPDMEARMAALLEQLDGVAASSQERGRRGAGRPATDDDDVAILAAIRVVVM